ncbi:hypothetical protein [Pseudonocardia broussonetiae]|uniref:Uncharacterized protein n=1 Tax=Pseudonocardia broussonetiae TaxID=2736640 RepID=A0A6M6JK94_9PSEU|nr:hypothetical protein [Pseudonocardia broussonetiae]QJY47786.1 hypothetical protein HOP40_19850 [Pseudonocardia broussonetiae]
MRLVGVQDTDVTVQHPGTDEAAVAVRIGRTLLYLHQQTTAEHFLNVWLESHEAARALPVNADRRTIRGLRGMPEPGVVVNAIGRPASSVTIVGEGEQVHRSYLRIQLGRVAFEVRDHGAFHSCTNAFRDAYNLARYVFVPPGSERVLRGAVDVASDAFFPALVKRDLRATPSRLRPAAAAPPQRSESGPYRRPPTSGTAR